MASARGRENRFGRGIGEVTTGGAISLRSPPIGADLSVFAVGLLRAVSKKKRSTTRQKLGRCCWSRQILIDSSRLGPAALSGSADVFLPAFFHFLLAFRRMPTATADCYEGSEGVAAPRRSPSACSETSGERKNGAQPKGLRMERGGGAAARDLFWRQRQHVCVALQCSGHCVPAVISLADGMSIARVWACRYSK